MAARRTKHPNARTRMAGIPPVLKLPPDLAVPALSVLASEKDVSARREELKKLRPGIPERTLLNAYVLPSLKELRLYGGSLRDGSVTRFGDAIAQAATLTPEKANDLFARQLVAIDRDRVGFVEWLLGRQGTGSQESRKAVYRDFMRDVTGNEVDDFAVLDRLGKWVGYLAYFGVVRGDPSAAATSALSIDSRHIRALGAGAASRVSDAQFTDAIREAYAQATRKLGSRLYIPINLLRDEVGNLLASDGVLLTDSDIDIGLRKTPTLLPEYTVTFSPFSGPAKGGLLLPNMYAGFISIREASGSRDRNY